MSGVLGMLYALPTSLFEGAVLLGDEPATASASVERNAGADQAHSALVEELGRTTLDAGATCLTCGIGERHEHLFFWPAEHELSLGQLILPNRTLRIPLLSPESVCWTF